MSRKIWEISKEKQQLYRKSAERLVAAGADLDLSSSAPASTPWVKITQVPEMLANYVRMSPGGLLYVALVHIVALAPKVVIQEYRLSSSEWEVAAWFPGDPRENRSSDPYYYYLPDHSTFHRDEVLNHRVGAQGTLHHGDVMEGLLLAQSFDPIPERYRQGSVMQLCLSIVNQFGKVEPLLVDLHVDRTAEQLRPRPARMSTLFEREDGRIISPEALAETHVAGMVRDSRSPSVENCDDTATSTGPQRG
jgi:hypothetical protein